MKPIGALLARFDRLAMRERLLTIAALGVLVAALAWFLGIAPALDRHQKNAAAIQAQNRQLQDMRKQVEALAAARNEDPDAPARARLAALRKEIEDIDRLLAGKQERLVPADQMRALLEKVLARHARIELVSLRTLPAAPLVERAPEKDPKAARAAPAEALLYRHGFELSVRGAYLDLLAYVGELEQLPWAMFWTAARLNAEDFPAVTLTLKLNTLSRDPAWLRI